MSDLRQVVEFTAPALTITANQSTMLQTTVLQITVLQTIRRYLIPALLLCASGCVTYHTSESKELDDYLEEQHTILIIEPRVEVKVQLISTDEFRIVKTQSRAFAEKITAAMRAEIESRGQRVILQSELSELSSASRTYLEGVREDLLQLASDVIANDPDHQAADPSMIDATGVIPAALRRERVNREEIDMVLALGIQAQHETTRQFWHRWFSNVGLNLIMLPLSLISTLIPVAMPISINVSTSIVEHSPDRTFASMVVLDVVNEKILYHADYYDKEIPVEPEDFEALIDLLFSEFGREREEEEEEEEEDEGDEDGEVVE